MESVKMKDQLLNQLIKMQNKHTSMRLKLHSYKVYMYVNYSLAVGLFGFMLIIMIIKTLS